MAEKPTLTPAERQAMRERCEKNNALEWHERNHHLSASNACTDLPRCLDALDAQDAEIASLREDFEIVEAMKNRQTERASRWGKEKVLLAREAETKNAELARLQEEIATLQSEARTCDRELAARNSEIARLRALGLRLLDYVAIGHSGEWVEDRRREILGGA